jgi:hypothetical protein
VAAAAPNTGSFTWSVPAAFHLAARWYTPLLRVGCDCTEGVECAADERYARPEWSPTETRLKAHGGGSIARHARRPSSLQQAAEARVEPDRNPVESS